MNETKDSKEGAETRVGDGGGGGGAEGWVNDLQKFFCQLSRRGVPLLLGGFHLRLEDVRVDFDLFLSLLHRHLQLKLPVLQAENLVGLGIQVLAQPLDLELQHIVTNHALLFRLHEAFQVALTRVVLHFDLRYRCREPRRLQGGRGQKDQPLMRAHEGLGVRRGWEGDRSHLALGFLGLTLCLLQVVAQPLALGR